MGAILKRDAETPTREEYSVGLRWERSRGSRWERSRGSRSEGRVLGQRGRRETGRGPGGGRGTREQTQAGP